MDIVQTFYDSMASRYDKLFSDWLSATREQGQILSRLFRENGFDETASVLDCACGIGTQAMGLAALGYTVTASDISPEELAEARQRAEENHVSINFAHADFRKLQEVFPGQFDLVICMDNAIPHMLTEQDLEKAVRSMLSRVTPGGMFVASIRDYDALLAQKPPYSPPYIHKTERGQRVSFQTWDWEGIHYKLTQYILEDTDELSVSKFVCEYRALTREELTKLLTAGGAGKVVWKFPEETGFYQPIVLAYR